MEDIEKLQEYDNLKTKVLKYILYKKRTEYEVRQKFLEAENPLFEDVIQHIKELGYINDEDYIKRSVLEFMTLRNLSIKEIKYKLYSKGISRNLIEDYMYSNKEQLEQYEVSSAKRVILKKSNVMESEEIIEYLIKKGYSKNNIDQALGETIN